MVKHVAKLGIGRVVGRDGEAFDLKSDGAIGQVAKLISDNPGAPMSARLTSSTFDSMGIPSKRRWLSTSSGKLHNIQVDVSGSDRKRCPTQSWARLVRSPHRPGRQAAKVVVVRGCSSMVEHQLPKLDTRVRFPSPAPISGAE